MKKSRKRYLIGLGLLLLLLAGWIACRFQNPLVPESDRVSYSWSRGEPGGGLRGIVTDGQGNPLANRVVEYVNSSAEIDVGKTDAGGCFDVVLPGNATSIMIGAERIRVSWISRNLCRDMVLTVVIANSQPGK